MPTVKSQTFHKGGHHATCSARRKYLEQDNRHLDRICLNVANPERWAQEMDKTREAYRLRGSVTYREFILSPDVADNADLDTVRDMAIRWCEENFPSAEVTIIFHDDNKERLSKGEQGIVHAHCVINSVDLDSGRKVTLSRPRVRELHNSLQRIGKELGLSVQPDYCKGERLTSRKHAKHTLAERQMELRRSTSWKSVVRDMALQALLLSDSVEEFARCLDKADIDVVLERGRIYLVDRDNPTRVCRADRLDDALSVKCISAAFNRRCEQSERSALEKTIKEELIAGDQMRKEIKAYDQKCRKALEDYRKTAVKHKGVAHKDFPKFLLPHPKTETERERLQETKASFGFEARRIRQRYEKAPPSSTQRSTTNHVQSSSYRNHTPQRTRSTSRGR